MKRAVIMLVAVLITALAVFSVNSSAHATDSSLRDHISYSCGTLNVCTVTNGGGISFRDGLELLDAQTATEYDADEIKEDGINTRVATIWIICIGTAFFVAVMIFVIVLAKKNTGQK